MLSQLNHVLRYISNFLEEQEWWWCAQVSRGFRITPLVSVSLKHAAASLSRIHFLVTLGKFKPSSREFNRLWKWTAACGSLQTLQWAREINAPWKNVCSTAALNGHLELIQWARENGAPWNAQYEGGLWDTCACAAKNGHMEILQWARENGAPWDQCTCASAAEYGHLEILQWARENGAPWDELTCDFAAQNGHTNILQWAQKNGAPIWWCI